MRAGDIVGWTDYTEHGSTVRWKIDGEGALVVESLSGTVGVLDYSGYPPCYPPYYPPWYSSASSVASFRVSDGCTIECRNSLGLMFDSCCSLASLDLTGLDTSAVTNMCGTFCNCSALTSLDLSGIDTSAVADMSDMFAGCMSLASLDLSGIDTSAVTDMSQMFEDCPALLSLDLSSFDTSRVGEMSYMFSGCTSLVALDLSSFDTSAVTNMGGMFSGDQSLREVRLGGAFGFVAGETSTMLPDPRGDGYTGRWVRVSPDGSYVEPAYAPEELRDNWAPELAGTWVWERQ